MSSESNASNTNDSANKIEPIAILILGMAGSGKTTLTSKLISYFRSTQRPSFSVNLDPAVFDTGYTANIDIRDTIKYKEVMKQYSLGPNGAIVTSLNLFTTKFDQVMDIISQRTSTHKYFTFDTPGQVEVFTWSASGTIISETLARSMPSVILYIMDTPRNENVASFMSNMLYACKVAMSYQLPFIAVFNKIDILHSKKIVSWMTDFELFLKEFEDASDNRVAYSLSLVLEDFYNHFKVVSVSSTTGDGFEELVKAIDEARVEYNRDFKPIYDQQNGEEAAAKNLKVVELNRSLKNLSLADKSGIIINPLQEYEESDEDEDY